MPQSKRIRAVVAPGFGRLLERLRGNRTPQQIVQKLAALDVSLNRSTLWQYEHGTVSAPDPVVLWALGKIYKTDVSTFVDALVTDRQDRGTDSKLEVVVDNEEPVFSSEERELVRRWRELSPGAKKDLRGIIWRITGEAAAKAKRSA